MMRALFFRLTAVWLSGVLMLDPVLAAAPRPAAPPILATAVLFSQEALVSRPLQFLQTFAIRLHAGLDRRLEESELTFGVGPAQILVDGWHFLRHPARRPYVKLAIGVSVSLIGFVHVLLPEFYRYMAVVTGQVGLFKIGTNPGQDFSGYYGGAKAYFDYHINPYSNSAMWDLFNYRTGTHMLSVRQAINTSLSVLIRDHPAASLGQAGYVPTPPNLWFDYAFFARWMPFDQAMKVWALFSSAVVSGMTMLFGWTLSRDRHVAGKLGDALVALTLFFILFRPAQDSIILGNIDAVLYSFLAGLAAYLFAFKGRAAWAWKTGALLLALATGLKIAPIAVAGYFAIGLAQKLYQRVPWKTSGEARMLTWFSGGLAAVAGITLTTIRWEVIATWIPKMREFALLEVDPVTSPTLWRFLHYWAPQLFGEGMASFAEVGMWLARLGALFLVVRIVRRRGAVWISEVGLQARHFLLFVATILPLLPTLSPHWWFTYNSAMTVPFLVLYHEVKESTNARARLFGITALVLAYAFINLYGLYVADYSGLSPLFGQFRQWLIATTTHLNPDGGLVRTPYLVNLFSPYPGTVLLAALAGWLWRNGGWTAPTALRSPGTPRGTKRSARVREQGSRRRRAA